MRSVLVAAGAAVLLVVLSGCDGPPPHVTPVPTPSVTPVFASDEEALAAAEESYAAYLAVSDQIFAEGGVDADRLRTVATGTFLEASLQGFQEVQASGWHSTGVSKSDSYQLQKVEPAGLLSVYLCTDVSDIDVLDSTGQSVVSPDRPNRTLFEVTFEVADTHLLVASREVWGNGQC